jgi:hypothetical protein
MQSPYVCQLFVGSTADCIQILGLRTRAVVGGRCIGFQWIYVPILTHYIAKDIYSKIPRGAMQPRMVLFSSVLYAHNVLVETTGVHTEWQWPLSGVHSNMMEKSAQPGEGGECTPTLPSFIVSTIT